MMSTVRYRLGVKVVGVVELTLSVVGFVAIFILGMIAISERKRYDNNSQSGSDRSSSISVHGSYKDDDEDVEIAEFVNKHFVILLVVVLAFLLLPIGFSSCLVASTSLTSVIHFCDPF